MRRSRRLWLERFSDLFLEERTHIRSTVGSAHDLGKIYRTTLSFVVDHLSLLLDIAGDPAEGMVDAFDFLANSILRELMRSLPRGVFHAWH